MEVVLFQLAASGPPTPFLEGAVFQNTSGRYVELRSEPSLGSLKGDTALHLIAGDPALKSPMSECMWGSYKSVLFLGAPPKACRRGERYDGISLDGFALVTVTSRENVESDVVYPMESVPLPHFSVGPFSACRAFEDVRGRYYCEAEPYSSVEVFGNSSSVWVHDASLEAQSALLQGLGIFQAVLFAVMAARGKHLSRKGMTNVMALAADAAAGGAVTQAFILSTGRSVVGLDTEVGLRDASMAEVAVTAWIVSLAVLAYLHAAAYETQLLVPKLNVAAYDLPFKPILRELCEIPLLTSLVVIWPESAGPHFLIQLQFMSGLAVSFIAGRAAGLLHHFGTRYQAVLATAFMVLGGIATGAVLCVGTVAASGAVIRGGPTIAFALALQVHACAGGYFFGTKSRLEQIAKGGAGSPSAPLQAQM